MDAQSLVRNAGFEDCMGSIHDSHGRFVDVAGDTESVMGFTADELLDSAPYGVIHVDDVPTLSAYHVRLLGGEMDGAWVRFRRKLPDGSFRWMESQCIAFDHEAPNGPFTTGLTRVCPPQDEAEVISADGARIL